MPNEQAVEAMRNVPVEEKKWLKQILDVVRRMLMMIVCITRATMPLCRGESFQTFEELETIKEHEQSRSVQLWRRDSRTINAAHRQIDRPLNSRLKYYEDVYACIHGGRKFKTKGQGMHVPSQVDE